MSIQKPNLSKYSQLRRNSPYELTSNLAAGCISEAAPPVQYAQTVRVKIAAQAAQAAQANITHEQYLYALAEMEVHNRDNNAQAQRIRQARFPAEKTLEQFDFAALSTLNKPLILKLA